MNQSDKLKDNFEIDNIYLIIENLKKELLEKEKIIAELSEKLYDENI